jgi:transposase InsO family protein
MQRRLHPYREGLGQVTPFGAVGHHRTTRIKCPQSNGIVERLHRTLLEEHFRVEGRRTWFKTIEEMQAVLDDFLVIYNQRRPHQGSAA